MNALLRIALLFSILGLSLFSSITAIAEEPGENQDALDFRLLHQAFNGDIDEMAKQRLIRVLMPYSKTFFFFDGAQPRGASYDLSKEFETFINEKFKTKTLKINVLAIPTARKNLFPYLEQGLGDIAIGNLTITDERTRYAAFSDPIAKDVSEILVSSEGADPVNSIFDLAGRKVHVRRSSSYYESLANLNKTLKSMNKPEIQIVEANDSLEDEDLLEMVNAGLIRYMVIDSHKGEFWAQVLDKITLHPDIKFRTGGEIAWAMRKSAPGLAKYVNEFIAQHKQGTLLGNILIKKYLKDTSYIDGSIYNEHLERFKMTVRIFEKYGAQYRFDHLMLAALAYQESKLDQRLQSNVGAVGVMQILPSTAKDKNVGIPDIRDLDPNIHAGTKYLRFMADNYFANEPDLDNLNRTLFSFASYNAGPAKVASLRKETAEMGLDPNVWFANVEVVAAKRIGRETVQYVSNIMKYYVAYKLLEDKMQTQGPVHLIGSGKKKK